MNIYPQHLSETDSTNRVLKELAVQGAPEGTLIAADCQSGGYGRYGRNFFSPEGGLYFSFLLKPASPSFEITLITTAAAVACAQMADELCGDENSRIKWVNDIYRDGRKVCGILAEGQIKNDSVNVILGIGVNLLAPKSGYPEDIKNKAGALFPATYTDKKPAELRELALASFLRHFLPLYEALPSHEFMEAYRSRMFLIDRPVSFKQNGLTHQAYVTGVADDGALLLSENGRPVRLAAGEVSLTFEP